MKIALLFAILFWSFIARAETPASWTSIYLKNKPKIPIIISGGGICSGALIEKDMVVTATHCVDRFYPIYVYFPGLRKINANILMMSQVSDIALLHLESKVNMEPIKIKPESERNIEGTVIATIGHPVGQTHFKIQSVLRSEYTHVLSAGLISRVTDEGFVSDMSVSPGNSGGPVFDLKGEIIGVVSKKRIDRFVGQLNFVSSHVALQRLLNKLRDQSPQKTSLLQASTSFDVYLLYVTPTYRKNSDGDAKSYLNIGARVDVWDRLRLFVDTNLDSEEVFTEYGVGWNFFLQGKDPIQFYRLIPYVENLRFQWKDNGDQVEKRAFAYGLMVQASWFPFFMKYSQYQKSKKSFSTFGFGVNF